MPLGRRNWTDDAYAALILSCSKYNGSRLNWKVIFADWKSSTFFLAGDSINKLQTTWTRLNRTRAEWVKSIITGSASTTYTVENSIISLASKNILDDSESIVSDHNKSHTGVSEACSVDTNAFSSTEESPSSNSASDVDSGSESSLMEESTSQSSNDLDINLSEEEKEAIAVSSSSKRGGWTTAMKTDLVKCMKWAQTRGTKKGGYWGLAYKKWLELGHSAEISQQKFKAMGWNIRDFQRKNLNAPTPVAPPSESVDTVNTTPGVVISNPNVPPTLMEHIRDYFTATYSLSDGDVSSREKLNKPRKSPTTSECFQLNYAFLQLWNDIPSDNHSLWSINCAMYAIAAGWSKFTGTSTYTSSESINYVKLMKPLRKRIAQIDQEIRRLKAQSSPTKRQKRILKALMKDSTDLSMHGLEELRSITVGKLRVFKNKARLQLKKKREQKANTLFQNRESEFYGRLNSSNTTPTTPVDSHSVFDFWEKLWTSPINIKSDAKWIQDCQNHIAATARLDSNTDLNFNPSIVKQAIQFNKNWSGTGVDYIHNFWWKKITASHNLILDQFCKLHANSIPIPTWLCFGRTVLLPKGGPNIPANFRPITCLLTLYKWFTKCILICLDYHLSTSGIMDVQQRGAKKNNWGCVDNLLIDKMIIEDATMYRRKSGQVCMLWQDTVKAYDSIQHKWIEQALQIHLVPNRIISSIMRLVAL